MSAIVTVYTGLMGDGKTLKVVHDLINEMEEDAKRPVEKQINFYTNIDGLKIEGVLTAPDDWRKVLDNSLVIYDEADLIGFYEASRKSEVTDLLREIKLARKRNIRIWFIVQHPSMINAFVRRITGRHIHVQRPLGAELTKVFEWSRIQDKPDDYLVQKNAESTYLFKFPKHLYNMYDSVNVDTYHETKFKIPSTWIKSIITVIFLIILMSIFIAYKYYNYQKVHPKDDEVEEVIQGVQDKDEVVSNIISNLDIPLSQNETIPIDTNNNNLDNVADIDNNEPIKPPVKYHPSAVIMDDNNCIAYDDNFNELDITLEQCFLYM